MSSPLTPEEVTSLRSATPGCANVVHLNHAGSSLPTNATLDRQISHLQREAEIGGYEAAAETIAEDAAVYESIAGLIGATSSEVARVEHATAGWNAAFWSVPMQPGQRIVTAQAAYGANAVGFLRAKQRRGVVIDVVPDDTHGQVDVEALAERLDDDVALVAITHVPTNGGLVNPAAAIGRLTRAAGVPYLLDACQSVGQLDIDVSEIQCDLLSATGRKYLRGPRGTGFVYAASHIVGRLVPDHPDHHGATWTELDRYELRNDARRFEQWEYGHAGWLALGVAVEQARATGLDRIEATVRLRADELRSLLAEHAFEVMDLGIERCGIVTVDARDFDADEAMTTLRSVGVNLSVSRPSSTLYDATNRSLAEMLRLSVHAITTADEIDRAVTELVRAVR